MLSHFTASMAALLLLHGVFFLQQAGSADAPLPPEEAAATMELPDGFRVTLFAGEPDIRQPIAFCIDDRARLWVCEATNYPVHGLRPGDRILVFEDRDNDGRFDKRTVFTDQLNYVTGIEVGFGGVWVMSPPYFYFFPDKNGDAVPDGKPTVLLDGFGNHANSHNLANGFSWGPDGWLYGTHGRTNYSQIGKPGCREKDRVRFDGGVWRYHPVLQIWEPFCDGTTNPWGIDWNDLGEAFITNCVNPHLFQAIEGAHYEPWRNRKSSEYAYQRIATIADHLHYVAGDDLHENLGTEEILKLGGGHAHCGSMVYLGDSFPPQYRNSVFMNNIHGHRINNDFLKRKGSGYMASHHPDLMISPDSWFMGVTLRTGPDGSVFVTDWSDTGECHSVRNTHKDTGRIYKISYGKRRPPSPDLKKLSSLELVKMQLRTNDWFVRHARRILQERSAMGEDMSEVQNNLRSIFLENPDITRKLRALWALQATAGLSDEFLISQLNHPNESIRAWAVRLLCLDSSPPKAALEKFRQLAASGNSPLLRRYLCSALQRIDPSARWGIAAALASRAEDSGDQNIPLLLWYAVEPLIHEDASRFLQIGLDTTIPQLSEFVARRLAEATEVPDRMDLLISALSKKWDAEKTNRFLDGILSGLEGTREMPMPNTWPLTYGWLKDSENESVRAKSIHLALIFNDADAMKQLRIQASDSAANVADRRVAIGALIEKAPRDLAPLLIKLVDDPVLRGEAIRGLARYDYPDTAAKLMAVYPSLTETEKRDVLQTLTSRIKWAERLVDALEKKEIPRSDLLAYTARQLLNLNDPALTRRFTHFWGKLGESSKEKTRLIQSYTKRLSAESIASADPSAGRVHFQKLCAPCHQMFGEGGNVGPELTGSQRTNLDYLLQNILDPSFSVSKDYQMHVIETSTGRTISGFIAESNERSLTIRTINESVIIPVSEISKNTTLPVSIMPEGLLQQLSTKEVRELIAYLSAPRQVPLQ